MSNFLFHWSVVLRLFSMYMWKNGTHSCGEMYISPHNINYVIKINYMRSMSHWLWKEFKLNEHKTILCNCFYSDAFYNHRSSRTLYNLSVFWGTEARAIYCYCFNDWQSGIYFNAIWASIRLQNCSLYPNYPRKSRFQHADRLKSGRSRRICLRAVFRSRHGINK